MNILGPLLKGNTVSDPAALKRFQNLTNIVVAAGALINAIFPATSVFLTPQMLMALMGLVSAINVYITTASTDKIGL